MRRLPGGWSCGLSTVTRTKRRIVEGNLEWALSIATACSQPPTRLAGPLSCCATHDTAHRASNPLARVPAQAPRCEPTQAASILGMHHMSRLYSDRLIDA